MAHQLHLIAAGGTIDKVYDALTGQLVVGPAKLPQVLATSLVAENTISVSQFLQKDSLDITDCERGLLAAFVADSPAEWILITHGTDTMRETADAIAALALDKTVVLTGAMVPHGMLGSDAEFNIGFAFAAVQLLPPGVYIAMHGRALPYDQCRKDRAAGRFVAYSLTVTPRRV